MAVETLFPNGDDAGWPTGGFGNIDESIASADGLTYETSIDNDVTVIDLDASAIADADTVNSVTVKIRAKDTGASGKNSLIVDLLIGGVGQGPITGAVLNNSYATYTFVDAVNWDIDWTAAQLDGMQLQITADQTGKGTAADWQIDAIDVDIDWTAGAAAADIAAAIATAVTVAADVDAPGKLESAQSVALAVAAAINAPGTLAVTPSLALSVVADVTDGAASFGDLIKSDHFSEPTAVSTSTGDLGSNPTSGNLLIAAFCSPGSATTVTTPPAGFTLLHLSDSGSGANWYWYFKVSDGTEQTAAIVFDTTGLNGVLYAEYKWDGSIPTITKNEDTTNISGSVTTQASGAATPVTGNNIAIALHGIDDASFGFSGQAVDGSWIEDFPFLNDSGGGGVKSSRLVNVTGSQEATHTSTGTADQMYGAIAIFDVASNDITATLSLTAVVAADLDAIGGLTSAQAIALTASADLDAQGKVEAAAALALAVASDLRGTGEITAALALQMSVLADLDALGQLNAATVFALSVAADITADGKIEAATNILFSVAADITDAAGADLAAAIGVALIATPNLNAPGTLAAAPALTLSAAADLRARGKLEAANALILQLAADLDAVGSLSSTAALALTTEAVISAPGLMSAAPTMTLSVLADVQDGAIPGAALGHLPYYHAHLLQGRSLNV